MTASLYKTAARLHEKVKNLVGLHQALLAENEMLTNERNRLEKALEESQIRILEVEAKLKAAATVQTKADREENNGALKLKINELVREVDKCISLLNN